MTFDQRRQEEWTNPTGKKVVAKLRKNLCFFCAKKNDVDGLRRGGGEDASTSLSRLQGGPTIFPRSHVHGMVREREEGARSAKKQFTFTQTCIIRALCVNVRE